MTVTLGQLEVADPYTTPTFAQWAEAARLAVERTNNDRCLGPDSVQTWEEWADQFIALPLISNLSPPSPHGFTRWQDWAARLRGLL